jgi:hypothetical protein
LIMRSAASSTRSTVSTLSRRRAAVYGLIVMT